MHARISFTDEPGGSLSDEYFKRSGNRDHRWWSQTGSNRRPPACKAGALPTELWPRSAVPQQRREMVGLGRFELPTSRLSSARSNQLSYRPNSKASKRTRFKPTTQNPLRAKGCSNDAMVAWARPRRKRNVDGEVLQIGNANPETDIALMILSDPIEICGCKPLKDHP
jgi:hypothetical protein